jgi:carboxylesterase type B
MPLIFGPVIEKENHKDEVFLPEKPIDIIKKGKFNKVPLIIGVTSREGLLIISGMSYFFLRKANLTRSPSLLESLQENGCL